MEETILFIIFGLCVAVCGAWDTAKQRHHMASSHHRRKTD